MDVEKTADLFRALGGTFYVPPAEILEKYLRVKAFIFDWDGVFNDGIKYTPEGSLFSEADAMGTNMLRFGHYLRTETAPYMFIVTGANNLKAIDFAKREHFHGVFLNYVHKEEALAHICEAYSLTPDQIGFFFDDVLDLGLAHACGLAFYMRRKASPLFAAYLQHEALLCDYATAQEGGQHAVREGCELLLGLSGMFPETIRKRVAFHGAYSAYLAERNSVETEIENYW